MTSTQALRRSMAAIATGSVWLSRSPSIAWIASATASSAFGRFALRATAARNVVIEIGSVTFGPAFSSFWVFEAVVSPSLRRSAAFTSACRSSATFMASAGRPENQIASTRSASRSSTTMKFWSSVATSAASSSSRSVSSYSPNFRQTRASALMLAMLPGSAATAVTSAAATSAAGAPRPASNPANVSAAVGKAGSSATASRNQVPQPSALPRRFSSSARSKASREATGPGMRSRLGPCSSLA